jgi:N-acetylated-alpha-linked acidic dipeptidase
MRPWLPLLALASLALAADPTWEQKFRGIPDPKNLRDYMQRLAARPHHVGSPYDKDNAEWIAAQLRSWGLDAKIENFDVLFPTPKERLIELVAPTKYTAKLEEPAVAADPTSNQQAEQLPVYHAYSVDGEATAPLIFVNYGIPADYEELQRMGISVSGAIVIAKYGGSWRGIKPKVAAEHGALACIVYSDPKDDGYFGGDVFPEGPQRPADGAQRGSVMDMPLYPGDPLTPGIGAVPGAKRLALAEAQTITKIPVLPMSYGDAQHLLSALQGPLAPAEWRGALPITYHIGPGPAKVHMKVKSNWDTKKLYDVIVRIPGTEFPDEWIVRGNHHDGWVNGAEDPVSGAVAEMEEARGLAALLKQGWKPKRTIIYAFWDGEEPGLLGSTEWAETHAEELQKHAVVYINSDGNGRGFFRAEGSHTLENFVNGVMKDITDPETGTSVWKRAQLAGIARAPGDRKKEFRTRPDLRMAALGSGSDYTVFIDHLGVASLNFGYGGEGGGGGVYHSIYDDFYWYTHFADTDFVYGRALAQTTGTAVIRLADAAVLPFQFGDLSETVHTYVDEIKKLAAEQRAQIEEQNLELEEGAMTAAADPRKTFVPPSKQPVPPHFNFAPLDNSLDLLTVSAKRYDAAKAKANPASVAAINAKLIESERKLIDNGGLPGRPWFRHMIYAPGFYTGYGVKTIPAVREAIEQKRWQEADEQIVRVGKILTAEAELIDQATALVERAK